VRVSVVNQLALIPAPTALPALIAVSGEHAARRFLEFFAANIRNPHTRRAYRRDVVEFLIWCDDQGVPSIAAVQQLHVGAWIEQQTREHAAATAKARRPRCVICSTGW
jgi:site-specific recombinase XerD